jgi:hypothetical protein
VVSIVAIALFAIMVLGEYAGLIPHVELVGFASSGMPVAVRLYRQSAYPKSLKRRLLLPAM